MNYIKLSTLEYPRHQGDIRLEYPNMGEEFICPEDYALVHVEPIPEYDGTISVFEYNPPFEQNGKWVQNGQIRLRTEEEQAEFEKQMAALKPLEAKGTEPNVIG